MKKNKNGKRKQGYNSFEEYKKKFYPASLEQQSLKVLKPDDPYKIGVNLAIESLNKFKHLLLEE